MELREFNRMTVGILDNNGASRLRRPDKHRRAAFCEDCCTRDFEAQEDRVDIPHKKDQHRGARILQAAMHFALLDAGELDEFNPAEHSRHACTDKTQACLRQTMEIQMARICVKR